MTARYKQAKKLQAGLIPLSQQLQKVQQKITTIKDQQRTLSLLQTLDEVLKFKLSLSLSLPQKTSIKHAPLPIYREYQSVTGMKIWVGKNAASNELLTFQLANGRDWWIHVRGFPGSHVVIRLGKQQEPDSETLKDAFQLALHYSKARHHGEGEICFTQRKYVSRLRKKKQRISSNF